MLDCVLRFARCALGGARRVCCLLFVVCRVLVVVCCSVVVVWCSLRFAVYCSRCVICWLLFALRCLLFVGCCVSCVV